MGALFAVERENEDNTKKGDVEQAKRVQCDEVDFDEHAGRPVGERAMNEWSINCKEPCVCIAYSWTRDMTAYTQPITPCQESSSPKRFRR